MKHLHVLIGQPTQGDIAKHLRISQSSVSRALQGDQRISESVRRQILEAAKTLGYVPDPAVTVLARYRWKKNTAAKGLTLALLSCFPKPACTGFSELQAAAKASGYQLDMIDLNAVQSQKAILRILKARGISGVLIFAEDGLPVREQIKEVCEQYPAVSWNTRLQDSPCPGVVRDAYHRIADCCKVMAQNQFQQAAMIIPGNPSERLTDWIREMHAAWLLHRQGHPGWQDILFATYQKENWDEIAAKIRIQRPDALIASNEDIIVELQKRDLIPVRDFAFACMDVKDGRPWSGIQTLFPEVARRCIELLDDMIAHREVGSDRAWIQVVVRGKWINGTSM